jgi:hypothetical protein
MDPILRRIDVAPTVEALVDEVRDALRRSTRRVFVAGGTVHPPTSSSGSRCVPPLLSDPHWQDARRHNDGAFTARSSGRASSDVRALRTTSDGAAGHVRQEDACGYNRVDARIRYPTDGGLCEDSLRVLRRSMVRLVDAGVKLSFKLRHVGRSVSRRMGEIGQALRLRGDAVKEAIKRPTAPDRLSPSGRSALRSRPSEVAPHPVRLLRPVASEIRAYADQ